MSRSYECGQFERNYKAVRLCNWEVPADRARPLKPTSSKPPAKTEFIASDNGHLLGKEQHAQSAPPFGSAPARLLQPLSPWRFWAAWQSHGGGKKPAHCLLEPAASQSCGSHRL